MAGTGSGGTGASWAKACAPAQTSSKARYIRAAQRYIFTSMAPLEGLSKNTERCRSRNHGKKSPAWRNRHYCTQRRLHTTVGWALDTRMCGPCLAIATYPDYTGTAPQQRRCRWLVRATCGGAAKEDKRYRDSPCARQYGYDHAWHDS
jgi:hypothetical protein